MIAPQEQNNEKNQTTRQDNEEDVHGAV
jgi:hypothetical protein